MMKRLFFCVKKQDNESVCDQSKEKAFVAPNISWTHSWSSNGTRNALTDSSFCNIPNEIILRIFQFLSVPDLCNISLVCRSFKIIADQDDLWRSKCDPSYELHSKPYKHVYMEWIHDKNWRNRKLLELEWKYRWTSCIMEYPSRRPRRSKPQFVPVGGFNRHPNSTQELTINLSVDIDKIAPQLVSLLEKASHFQEQWQQPAVLKQMIQRYHRFMQLKALNPPNILLIPTLDIEMVWQTHLLRPKMYRSDCLRLFRRVIDHSLIIHDVNQSFKEEAFLDTCQLYEQKFDQKYCSMEGNNETTSYAGPEIYSYWDKTFPEFSSTPPSDYTNPFSFTEGDLTMDGKWLDFCEQFMSNTANKHPCRTSFFHRSTRIQSTRINLRPESLKSLKKSYERFLYMAAKYPLKDGIIPPTYAMDIIWHSHMQELSNYETDCLRLVGHIIYHDPWPTIEDKTMKKSCNRVNRFWMDEFQRDINTDHHTDILDQ